METGKSKSSKHCKIPILVFSRALGCPAGALSTFILLLVSAVKMSDTTGFFVEKRLRFAKRITNSTNDRNSGTELFE